MLTFNNQVPVYGLHLTNHTIGSCDEVTESEPTHFVGCSFSDCTFVDVLPVFHHCVFLGETKGLDFSFLKDIWDGSWKRDKTLYKLTRWHREWLLGRRDPAYLLHTLVCSESARELVKLHFPTLTTCYGLSKNCYEFLLAEWILETWKQVYEAERENKEREEDVPF